MRTWNAEEDDLLRHWQDVYGNRWSQVAKHLPGRTAQQAAQRWRHHGNPEIKKAKWSKEEDERLMELMQEHKGAWALIARHLPGRTDQQCMGRWRRQLDPAINKGPWDLWEDEALEIMVRDHGFQWAFMAPQIGNRTSQQCRQRWMQLHSQKGRATEGPANPSEQPAPGNPTGRPRRKARQSFEGQASDESSPPRKRRSSRARANPEDAENLPPQNVALPAQDARCKQKAGASGKKGQRRQGKQPLGERSAAADNARGSPDDPANFVVPRRPRNKVQLLGPEDEEAASSGQVHNGRIHTNVEGARGIRPAAVPAEISAQEQPGKDATKGVGLGLLGGNPPLPQRRPVKQNMTSQCQIRST